MIKTAIIYNHRGRIGVNGTGPVEIRVTVDRKAYYVNTGVNVKPKQFKYGRIVSCDGADEMNKKLEVMIARVDELVTESLQYGNGEINVADVRRRVWAPDNRKKEKDAEDMIAWMEAEISKLGVKKGTAAHYEVSVRALKESGIIKKWHELSVERIHQFDAYLHAIQKHQTDAEKKLKKPVEYISQATVRNYHKDIKALLGRAHKFGFIKNNPYDRLRGEIKRGDKETVEYLTDEERNKLCNMQYAEDSMRCVAKDMFVFQMFTGMAYSDMQSFDLDSCKHEGNKWIMTGQRRKTGVTYYIQLLPQALAVVQKYGGHLPQVAVQIYNRNLKQIAQDAGIKKRLTSHVARHTFATWALHNGVPIEIVSKMLGHSNIKQTQRYAKIMALDVFKQFDKLEQL